MCAVYIVGSTARPTRKNILYGNNNFHTLAQRFFFSIIIIIIRVRVQVGRAAVTLTPPLQTSETFYSSFPSARFIIIVIEFRLARCTHRRRIIILCMRTDAHGDKLLLYISYLRPRPVIFKLITYMKMKEKFRAINLNEFLSLAHRFAVRV